MKGKRAKSRRKRNKEGIRRFQNRFFIEPSLAATYWSVNTNLPDAFKPMERKWNNYFLGERGYI